MEKEKKRIDLGELIVPGIIIATMAVFLYQSIGIDRPEDNLRLVWIVVGVLALSLAVILFSIFRGEETDGKKKTPFRDTALLKRQGLLYGLVAAYIFLMNILGFIVSSTVMLPLMFLASGVKKYRLIFAISLLLPVVTYILFRRFFNILLPEGMIETCLGDNVLYRKWF